VTLLSYPLGNDHEIKGLLHVRPFRLPFVRDIRIGFSWTKLLLDLQQATSSVRLSALNKFDIFHGVEEAGFVAAWLSRIWRKPFIYDMHSHMSEQLTQCILSSGGILHRMVEKMENSSIRRSGGIITVSEIISERVRNISPKSTVVTLEDLPLSIDRDAAEVGAERLRTEFGLHGKTVLVYTGNFEPYQGVELMLDGMGEYIYENLDVAQSLRLLIVGGGSLTGEKIRYMQLRVRDLGIEPYTIFTGDRPEEEMGSFMALATGLLSPRMAGAHTPLKVYTYMSVERPILATRIAAHVGVLSDSNAYMADPHPKGIASALATMLGEAGLPNSLERVRAAKSLVDSRFSRTAFVQKLDSLYNQALA
jgi:glycosyltransferase involved in cell wall biosynthesis